MHIVRVVFDAWHAGSLRRGLAMAAAVAASLAGGCGGGGDGGPAGSQYASGSSASASSSADGTSNVVALVVGGGTGRGRTFNRARISITLCAPTPSASTSTSTSTSTSGTAASARCEQIDHVLVDTGSSGLRINRGALSGALAADLPAVLTLYGNAISECERFADTFAWGAVHRADVRIGGKLAANAALQLIDHQGPVPDECSGNGALARQDADGDSSNGIIGLGTVVADRGWYYACPAVAGCPREARASPLLSGSIRQIVSLFDGDNNGIVIDLPAVPQSRAATVAGTLTFGIGTRPGNALTSEDIYAVDASNYLGTSRVNGVDMGKSMLDTGVAFYWLDDRSVPVCDDGAYLCPSSPTTLIASLQDAQGAVHAMPLAVGSAARLFAASSGMNAYASLARRRSTPDGAAPYMYYGLPFFFGRRVFFALAGAKVTRADGKVVAGPFNAFSATTGPACRCE